MSHSPEDRTTYIAERISSLRELEPWANHLRIRSLEMEQIAKTIQGRSNGRLLEIGCGNGFGTAYLASEFEAVVATDLPYESRETHSIGLAKTRVLLDAVGVDNAAILGCAGDRLPFEDGTFDVVLSLFSLEHIEDREASLREILRVLAPNGVLVAAVPASAWSLVYPLAFYSGLARRAMARLARRFRRPSASAPGSIPQPETRVKDWTSFREAYPRFPLPNPHGEYPTYLRELAQQRPRRWFQLCQSAGFLQVRSFPLSVVPRALLDALLGSLGLRLYEALIAFDQFLCRRRWAVGVAQFLVLVCEKSESQASKDHASNG